MITLPSIYQDHMVLQRDQPIPLRGWASPNSEVRITLEGHPSVAHSDAAGHWRATLKALPAGGPHELQVACGKSSWQICDVLMGDIWICSGQSNMEWRLSRCAGGAEQSADQSNLRFLNVDPLPALEPAADWIHSPEWQPCSAQSAGRMSGVSYYFAQRLLQAHPDVPIGIVLVALGGTRIEPWMSPDALAAAGVPKCMPTAGEEELRKQLEVFLAGICRQDVETVPENFRVWADSETDSATWPIINLPCYWQDAGLQFNGVVWFRREVEIPHGWIGHPLELSLGECDKCERTYFNGHEIGRTDIALDPDAYAVRRRYRVPSELVRPGRNVIAVRVFSHFCGAGMAGPAEAMTLGPQAGETIPLQGPWRYQVESNFGNAAALHANLPSRLWNGMVAPLIAFPARGILWYQGESNADAPELYGRLFQELIRDWRTKWGIQVMPFYFVQLPGYGPGSTWPELRAAQAAALELSGTAMAVGIDQGERDDVHPIAKQVIGERLALLALKHCYGHEDVHCEGPVVLEIKNTEPHSLKISFALAEGLHASGADPAEGFAAAGDDGVFVALPPATIRGTHVYLTDIPPHATQIRFGWEAFPKTHLLNRHGLPVAPFCLPLP